MDHAPTGSIIGSENASIPTTWTPPSSPSLMIHTQQPTPPPSPEPMATQEEKNCETHEVFEYSEKFVEGIRMSVTHLLANVWCRYIREICYGCQTNNPSQKNHPCLDPDECFYQLHFEPLMKRLWTENFIPSISMFMFMNNVDVGRDRIMGAAEVLLNELKYADNVAHTMDKMSETWGEDKHKIKQLQKLLKCYDGECESPDEIDFDDDETETDDDDV
ncbi:uncharacterized protein LOC134126950 [Pungitius pungitius]|uniref:uncharacterized protein LOC134126950 n=1 Tax=Pungitius pungitius TaxID=134920 RepID=UPI002E107207